MNIPDLSVVGSPELNQEAQQRGVESQDRYCMEVKQDKFDTDAAIPLALALREAKTGERCI